MNVIRLREIIVGFVVACSIFACAKGSTDIGAGGSGGEGGDSWGGPGSSSSSSSSNSSSSSGATAQTTCEKNSADCNACIDCSTATTNGTCVTAYDNCFNDLDCSDLVSCLGTCTSGDTTCSSGCASTYSAGIPLYNTLGDCVFCQDCPTTCMTDPTTCM